MVRERMLQAAASSPNEGAERGEWRLDVLTFVEEEEEEETFEADRETFSS